MKRAAREKTAFRTGRSAPWPGLVAGLLWLLAGLSAGYWILLALGRSPVTPVAGALPLTMAGDVASVARALGAAAPKPAAEAATTASADSRYSLLGVVDQPGRQGAALIALGGQPPRPYRVGAALEGGLVLQSVDRRSARLGVTPDGPVTMELTLPAPAVSAAPHVPAGAAPSAASAKP